jgi:hypothetical protein
VEEQIQQVTPRDALYAINGVIPLLAHFLPKK